MKRPSLSLFLACLPLMVCLAFPTPLRAELNENPEYQTALKALADQLPSVAADKLQRLQANPTLELSAEDQLQLKLKLIESMARAGRAEQTLGLCTDPALEGNTLMHFWKATALADLGLYREAEATLRSPASDAKSPLHSNAVLSRSRLLELLDQPDLALKALTPLLESKTKDADHAEAVLAATELHLRLGQIDQAERLLAMPILRDAAFADEVKLLRGKVALSRQRFPDAAKIFNAVVTDSKDQLRPTYVDATIGLAVALSGQGKQDEAINLLVAFVNEAPEGAALGQAFQRLESLGYFQRPRVQAVLESWADSQNPNLRALTLFYGARKSDTKQAIQNLQRFREEHHKHFLFPAAMLKLADLYLDTGKRKEAEEVLRTVVARTANPEVQHYVAYLTGRARFDEAKFALAMDDFEDSSETDDPVALFNQAVSALYADNDEMFSRAASVLKLQSNAEKLEAELALERGLYLASRSQSGGISALKAFVKSFPDHPRVVEARIALAELYLLGFPPKLNSAREELQLVRSQEVSDDFAEQVDYLAVWIEHASQDTQSSIDAALHFLDTWKDSPRYAAVEMKLGEIYFAKKDYANALNHFELVVQHEPTGPLSETALFLAGTAASLTMNEQGIERALRLWGQVVDRGGPLAEEARRQQGLTKLKQDQPDDAIAVFQRVLEAKKLDSRIRMATLMNMGQALLRKADGNSDPTALLIQAIGVYDEILESKEANRYWKNQASVNKARCLERTLDDDSALEVYYNVVSQSPEAGLKSDEAAEYIWYYRAGFSAINLLRRREEWGAAVKLAERLSRTSGPRAQEAREIASQLRLEHFIPWDDPLN